MEYCCHAYCCHVWAGAPSCYLELLDKLQKYVAIAPTNAACLSGTLGSSSKCSQLKDTLKAFDDFRNKQQVYKVMFFDM